MIITLIRIWFWTRIHITMKDTKGWNKYYQLLRNKLADTSNRITRMSENPLSLSAKFCRTDIRKHFFSQRVVSTWNDLPCYIKTAPTLNTFKSRYKKYVKNF